MTHAKSECYQQTTCNPKQSRYLQIWVEDQAQLLEPFVLSHIKERIFPTGLDKLGDITETSKDYIRTVYGKLHASSVQSRWWRCMEIINMHA